MNELGRTLLGRLLDLKLSRWEEGILAASFMRGESAMLGHLQKERARVVLEAWARLSQLPDRWARDFCLEALFRT